MTLIEFLSHEAKLWTILHVFGVVLGLGAATITDILFFKFLRDFRISESEAGIMKTLSSVIWVALGILLVSGIGLYVPKASMLLQNGKFVTKLIILVIITVNGFLLNKYLQPKLISIHFAGEQPARERRTRRVAFILGAVSFTSWYFVFFLGSFRGVIISFWPLFSVYIAVLILAVLGSQFVEYRFWKKSEGGLADTE